MGKASITTRPLGDASPEGAAAHIVGTPSGVLKLGGAISALGALVAMAGIVVGVIALARGDSTQSVWFLILWEIVALVGAMFGAIGGLRGRFVSGPALTLLIAAGCLFVAAMLSERTFVTRAMNRGGNWSAAGGIRLLPFLAAQLALAGLLGACAAGAVLLRAPSRALASLLWGCALLAPSLAGLAAFGLPRTRGPIVAWLSANAILGAGAVVLGGLLVAGLFCVGVHKVIRAFEFGIAAGLVRPAGEGGSDKGDMPRNPRPAEASATHRE